MNKPHKRSIKGTETQQYFLFIEGVKPAILFLYPLRKYQKNFVDILMSLDYPYAKYDNRIMFFQDKDRKDNFLRSSVGRHVKEGNALGFPKKSIEDHYYNMIHSSDYVLVDYHGINFVSNTTYVLDEINEMEKTMPVPSHLKIGIRLCFEKGSKKWISHDEFLRIRLLDMEIS